MIPLRHLLIATALLLPLSPAWAGVNPGTPPKEYKKCSKEYPDHSSFEWNIALGTARFPTPKSFTSYAKTAYETDGNLPKFSQLYARAFTTDPLQAGGVTIEISQPQIDASTFHPSCLFLQSEAAFETLKKPAANGFHEYIHQVVTDDRFTLIDMLPAPDIGWRIRIWKSNVAALHKIGYYGVNGLEVSYDTSGFIALTPLTDVVFKRPTGSSDSNTLIFIRKETTGLSGTRTITNEIVQTLDANGKPATLTSKIFSGEGTTGPLLSEEDLKYSNRNARAWHYTIKRKSYTASVDAAGTIGALTLTGSTREDYDDYSILPTGGELGMKRLVSLTEAYDDPDLPDQPALHGQSPQTTTYTYIQAPTNSTVHGRLQSTVKPDGSWIYDEYVISPSNPIAIATEYSSWKDVTLANKQNARKTVTTVSSNNALVETYVAGQLVSKSQNTVASSTAENLTTSEQWDGSAWHVTATAYYGDAPAAPGTGRMKWVEKSDGTAATFTYASVSGNLVMTARTGAGNRAGITAGTEVVTTYGLGNFAIAQTTKDIASGLVTEQWVTDPTYNSGFDASGRPIKRIYNGDTADYDITQYACCGLEVSRTRNGATTTYSRDGLKRVYKVVTTASDASPPVATFTTIDGLTTTTRRSVNGGSSFFLGSVTRSLDGLTRASTAPSQKSTLAAERPVTTTITTHSATGDTATTTYADLSTAISTSFLDGQRKSTSGTAVAPMTYDYDVNIGVGMITYSNKYRNILTAPMIATYTDFLDRPIHINTSGTGSISYAYYPPTFSAGSRGKLHSVTDDDNVATTYGYNAQGERITNSRNIPIAGGDPATQVTTTISDVVADVTIHGVSLGVSRRQRKSGSSTGVAAVTISETFAAINGLVNGSRSLGRDTITVTTRPNSSGVATATTTNPDGTGSVKTTTHGLLTSDLTINTVATVVSGKSYTYDALQRPLTITDSRTGTATYDVNADGLSDVTESGKLLAEKDAASLVTGYAYDIMGRVVTTTLPDTSVTRSAYYPNGKVKVTWGSQTYPTWNVYDDQGHLTKLHTWKTAPTLDPASIPTDPPKGSNATTWIYGQNTNLLIHKKYADDKSTDYQYTNAGRLLTRKWARNVLTTYGYTYGLLTSVTYSRETNGHTTPNLAYGYDPLGRIATVTRGGTLHASYSYNPDDQQLTSEQLNQDILAKTLGRNYDGLLRPLSLEVSGEYATGYGYDTAGRMDKVWQQPALNATTKAPQGTADFNYTYKTGSSRLIHGVTGPAHTITNTWEDHRDVLKLKENKVGETTISSYNYIVNSLGQRTSVATDVTASTTTAPHWLWQYNSRGELEQANDTSAANLDRAYQYDSIGNREKTVNGLLGDLPSSPNYAANTVNQYTTANGINLPDPAYDDDGNLTRGPLPGDQTSNATLLWDAENRLVKVAKANGDVIATFDYDYLGRRIAKTAWTGGSAGPPTIYLYDGFNCIAEYIGTTRTHIKTFTWGLDLSNTLQGAGGVGGLIAVNSSLSTYYPTYDGNGNVSEYLASDGTVAAHFEYDPFGNLTVDKYSNSTAFPYRFSTKPQDAETGLYYYLYRYFDPVTGRWPSRDPIEEEGGLNMYGFVFNSPICVVDILGLSDTGSYSCGCDHKEVNIQIDKMSKKAGQMSGEDIKNVPERIRKYGFSRGREFGGRICCNSKTKDVTATDPKPSQSGDDGWDKDPKGYFWVGKAIDIDQVSPECQNGEEVGRYHSHPSGSDRFSKTDRDNTLFPLGVGTPDGKTSLLEAIGGDVKNPYGSSYKPDKDVNGWGINADGTLYPKNVVPNNLGGYTNHLKNY